MFLFFTFVILYSHLCWNYDFSVIQKNKLSKIIFLFLLLASFWHIDVSFLYAVQMFSQETIMFFFKLFRFGSIMLTPTIFYVGYTIVQEMLPSEYQKSGGLLLIGLLCSSLMRLLYLFT